MVIAGSGGDAHPASGCRWTVGSRPQPVGRPPALAGASGHGCLAVCTAPTPPPARAVAPGEGRQHGEVLAAGVLGASGRPGLLRQGRTARPGTGAATTISLLPGCRLIVPDLLGIGDSARPAVSYDRDTHADAVLACLDELGVQDRPGLVAHSLGCVVALRLAARHPDRVAAVVGFGLPVYRSPAEGRRHLASTGLVTRLFALDTPFARAVYWWVCGAHPTLAGRRVARVLCPDLPAPTARAAVQYSWCSRSDTLRGLILGAPAAAGVPQLPVPVRLSIGRADWVPDADLLFELAAAQPSLTVQIWPTGGHEPPLTQPRACLAAVHWALTVVTAHRPEEEMRTAAGLLAAGRRRLRGAAPPRPADHR
jgi:pimeloyl-ACP methyl ester carboxylesterase